MSSNRAMVRPNCIYRKRINYHRKRFLKASIR
nr:MAG TPA: hypothetical protein [Bacteriophage sp.]